MLDLPLVLASFMGDAQTSKEKKNNKNTVKTKQLSDVFSDTRWDPLGLLQRGMDSR